VLGRVEVSDREIADVVAAVEVEWPTSTRELRRRSSGNGG